MVSPDVVFSGTTSKGVPTVLRYPRKEDLREMWRMINSLSQERTFIMYQGEEISLREEDEYLSSQLEKIRKGNCVQLVAFCEDVLVGIASVEFQNKIERHIGVFGISVIQEFRGKGIGSLLMKKIFQEAVYAQPGLEMFVLYVFSNNAFAIKMYERAGFLEYGRLPRGVKLEHGYVDRISMYKPLKE